MELQSKFRPDGFPPGPRSDSSRALGNMAIHQHPFGCGSERMLIDLASLPEVRDDRVARLKKVIEGDGYPQDEIIREISRLLVRKMCPQ